MSLPLSDAEKCSAHEILSVFTDDDGVVHDGFGAQLTLTQLDELGELLDAKLTALSGAKLDKVRALIVAWDLLELDTTTVTGGQVGNIQGLDDDPEKDRALIRKRLIYYVPVMHIVDSLLQRKGLATNSATSSMVRILR